jgi:transcriptional regulator with XRE-family HTH domain
MIKKMPDLSTSALAYVRHVLHQTKMSPTGLAKRAGISSTTLTRALNDRKHRFSLSVKTLEKIYEASGISPAEFLNHRGSGELNTARNIRSGLAEPDDRFRTRFAESDSFFGQPGGVFSKHTGEAGVTPVVGTVAANEWRESTILDVIQFGSVTLRHSLYRPSECFVCLVVDDSTNRWARKNELLYCIRLDALKHSLQDHALIIVERRSENGLKIELTARQIIKDSGGWLLTFATTNQSLKEVIKIADLVTPRLRVIGVVDYVFRSPLPHAASARRGR